MRTHTRPSAIARLRALLLALLCSVAILITGCNGAIPGQQPGYRIGVFQMVASPEPDAERAGFIQALADAGYKGDQNLKLDLQNAQNEVANTQKIVKKFVADKVDMIYAIGTPTLRAAIQAAPKTMHVIYSYASDPFGAGVGASANDHLPNVTGNLSTDPVDREAVLIQELVPNAKRVGPIYNAAESNSQVTARLFKEAAVKGGLEVIEQTVSGPEGVPQAAQALAGQNIQAFAKVGDYATIIAFDAIIKVGQDKRIPVFSIDPSDVEKGALASIGWDYYADGYQAGQLAARVIKGESSAQIPLQPLSKTNLVINLQVAPTYGVTVPDSVVQRANKVIR